MKKTVLAALIRKDFMLLFRNRILSILPAATLAAIVIVYYLMPKSVAEEMKIGILGEQFPQETINAMANEGINITPVDDKDALYAGVKKGTYSMGIVIPNALLRRIAADEKPEIHVLFANAVIPEVKNAGIKITEQMVLALQGGPHPVFVTEEVLGPDMSGRQIATRDRLLPLFAVFILFMEIIGLGTLITEEYERYTISSILVTSVKIPTLLIAKSCSGVGITFIQAAILLAATGSLFHRPLLLLSGLFLGSGLVVGIAFLLAAVSRDMMSVIAWSMLVMILLFLPTLDTIFPGLISDWMKIIPSYHLTDLIHRVVHFDAGWRQVWDRLIALLLFDCGLLILGALFMRRKRI